MKLTSGDLVLTVLNLNMTIWPTMFWSTCSMATGQGQDSLSCAGLELG